MKTHSRSGTQFWLCTLALTGVLSGCGGGGGGGDGNAGGDQPPAPTTAALPSRSTTIALTSDDERLVVVNRQNNSVSILQVKDSHGADTDQKIAEIPVGEEPRYVAITPDDSYAYITNAIF